MKVRVKNISICVLKESILPLCTIFLLGFGTDPKVWYILFLVLFCIIIKNADTSIIAIIDQDCFQRLIQKHILINYADQDKLIIRFEFPPPMKLTSAIWLKY